MISGLIYYKVIVNRAWDIGIRKDKPVSPETDSHIYVHLIYDISVTAEQWGKEDSSQQHME